MVIGNNPRKANNQSRDQLNKLMATAPAVMIEVSIGSQISFFAISGKKTGFDKDGQGYIGLHDMRIKSPQFTFPENSYVLMLSNWKNEIASARIGDSGQSFKIRFGPMTEDEMSRTYEAKARVHVLPYDQATLLHNEAIQIRAWRNRR